MSGIPFIDLQAQRARIKDKIDAAIARVLDHGGFIMGPEVKELEGQLAAFCGAGHAIGCSSGTDAVLLPLMAKGVGPGDAVFVPAFTFTATAEVVALLGATPVFVDVTPDTYTLDPASLEAAVDMIEGEGVLKPKAVIGVGLFGQPADYRAINALAHGRGLFVIDDAAQSFGATLDGKAVGTLADFTATSFFPAKPLGCYGDGGAVFTDDAEAVAVMRSILAHGKGTEKYDNVRIGINARLDTLQAAILIEKLAIFPDEIVARQRVADAYNAAFAETGLITPTVLSGGTSVWAQYTLQSEDRDGVVKRIKDAGVPIAIYYPRAMTDQTAYQDYPVAPGGVPVSRALAQRVFSLPMHPYLEGDVQGRVIDAVKDAF